MSHKATYRATVISDTHLRAGRGDDFKFDRQFASLLDTVVKDGSKEIILNGDIFDFVATRPESKPHPIPGLGFTERESVERLEVIADAHPGVIEALRKHLRDGIRCVIIPGNHDWEFHWPGVRRRLAQMLGNPGHHLLQFVLGGQPYRPIPGLHIEHGHQLVDDQNIFHHPTAPVRPDPLGGLARVEQSVGNWLVRCLVVPIERYFPFVNNVKPFMKIGWFGQMDIHAMHLAQVLIEGAQGIFKDRRIPTRIKTIAFNAPTLRRWFGPSNSPLSKLRPEHLIPRLSHALNDDSTESLRRVARRHLQVFPDTRFMIMGHSHEIIDHDHELNRYFKRHGRAYLNPGCWNPCMHVDEDSAPLDIDQLVKGAEYPYKLAFVHLEGDRRSDLQAQIEVFEEDKVWLTALNTAPPGRQLQSA